MFGKGRLLGCAAALTTAVMVAGCAPAPSPTAPSAPAPSQSAAGGTALARACEGRDGWSDAAPPARIFGNSYYVGTCGIAVILVTSPQGHVLIDGATAQAVPSILANIRALGFDPRDVRVIVGSHEHVDHMGGFAALKAATGAQIWVSEAARTVVETGAVDPADPQFGIIPGMAPVPVHGIVRDGEVLTLGDSLRLTPMLTPGHTSGGTSWSWNSCEGEQCAAIAYIDSLSAVSREGYRFTDHPERVAPYRVTFGQVDQMPCDILVTPHPDFSNLFARLAGAAPVIERGGGACRRLSSLMRGRLDARLARERAGQ